MAWDHQVIVAMRLRSTRRYLASGLAVTIVCAAALVAASPSVRADDHTVRLMTQNMDPGSRLQAVAAAGTDPVKFLAAVKTEIGDIIASKPAERAAAVAREIADKRPDFVGLQAAGILTIGTDPTMATVQEDQLAALMNELDALHEHYFVVAVVPGLDAQVNVPGFSAHVTVHDAIIARHDPAEPSAMFIDVEVANFQHNLTFPTPMGPITDKRGWALVDVLVRGRAFRFVTTHLDVDDLTGDLTVQLAQAQELIEKAGNTGLPVVFAGDFNAAASDPSNPTYAVYQKLIDAGFVDGWKQEHPADAGFTCCQGSQSNLSLRIDLVMLRGAVEVEDIVIVGNQPSDRTPSGLWPSSHAGIAFTLENSSRLPPKADLRPAR